MIGREEATMQRMVAAGLAILGFIAQLQGAFGDAPPSVILGRPTSIAPPVNQNAASMCVQPAWFAPADNASSLVQTQATAPVFPPPGPGIPTPSFPGSEPYNCGVVSQPPAPADRSFWDKCKGIFGSVPGLGSPFESDGKRQWFESDHCFDNFISPVSNPFYFEDPRSLTEVRPIFIWETAPSHNPVFGSGNVEFFGLQARLAVTDRLSFVINKLGGIWQQPDHTTDEFGDKGGFAELWLGPKYTFLRCESTGTLGAVGLTFQIPAGSGSVEQDTGDLSLVPYISLAQSFWRSSYGTFNAMATIGYDLRCDNQRSESFFTSWHLDYDIGNFHRIYPLVEINWFHYTRSGKVRPLNFEGRDLFNFGSEYVAGQNEASIALGARYKFRGSEAMQFGVAAELPIASDHGMQEFRLTLDMIFRY
jgi:hypothetical protein